MKSRFTQEWRHREVIGVAILALVLMVLWRMPVIGIVFYPLRLFGTFVHEISHGLAAVLTGGQFHRFVVNPDLSGVAWSAGGARWVVSSAGYLGSALFGGFLTVLSARGAPARTVLFWMGVVLGVMCLLFVRNIFGIFTGMALAAGLVLASQRLNALWADMLLLFLSVQMMLDSIDSVFGLVQLSTRGFAHTDAGIMAQATGIPAVFWATLWTGISIAILFSSLRMAYRRAPDAVKRETVVVTR